MSNSHTMSSPDLSGLFVIRKGEALVRGRIRRTRTLQFVTTDGFVGESRTHDRTEAKRAASAAREQGIMTAHAMAATCPKSPGNVAMALPHNLDTSTLCALLESRGYSVGVT